MWNFTQETEGRANGRRALILDRDSNESAGLHWALKGLGYHVEAYTELEPTLAKLRSNVAPRVVFFSVEASGEMLDGTDFSRMIGELIEDRALFERHAFTIISSTPDTVELILGKALRQLQIPVFSKNYDFVAIARYLSLTMTRLTTQALLHNTSLPLDALGI